jgi:regulatory protein
MNNIIDVAIRHLSEKNCSEKELRLRLEKNFSELTDLDERIESAITRLRELHLINDARLAESLVRRYAHKGNRFIHQALRQKGVRDDVIDEILATLDDEVVRALDEARKKLRSLHWDNTEKTKAKLSQFLSGRGFSFTAIKSVIEKLEDEGCFLENSQA